MELRGGSQPIHDIELDQQLSRNSYDPCVPEMCSAVQGHEERHAEAVVARRVVAMAAAIMMGSTPVNISPLLDSLCRANC